jgi:hypothetical protein
MYEEFQEEDTFPRTTSRLSCVNKLGTFKKVFRHYIHISFLIGFSLVCPMWLLMEKEE